VGASVGWTLLAPLATSSVSAWALPSFLVSSILGFWAAAVFLIHPSSKASSAGKILGVLFLILSLHRLGYVMWDSPLFAGPGLSWYEPLRSAFADLLFSVMAIFMIIVALEETGSALKTTEARSSKLFHETDECLIVFDPGLNRIVDANRRLLELSGYTLEEILSRDIGELLTEEGGDSSEPVTEWVYPSAEKPRSTVLNRELHHREGRAISVSLRRSVIEAEVGKQLVLVQVHDETEAAVAGGFRCSSTDAALHQTAWTRARP
jgi:PAS domain S-box-containing protein